MKYDSDGSDYQPGSDIESNISGDGHASKGGGVDLDDHVSDDPGD
jgi:hypothetical protein